MHARLARTAHTDHVAQAREPDLRFERPQAQVELKEVLIALARVLKRADMYQHHQVQMEPLSVRERMSGILSLVNESRDFVPFTSLFSPEEGRLGVVVAFLAIMELLRESLIEFVQNQAFGPIYVRAAGEASHGAS